MDGSSCTFALYSPMGFLRDNEARAAAELADAKRVASPQLAEAVHRLLDDRRARTALLHRISRELQHVRGRLAQASRYLEGLLANVQRTAGTPWPGKVPCPLCGAPADQVVSEYRTQDQQGHVLVHAHADGTRCEAPVSQTGARSEPGDRSATPQRNAAQQPSRHPSKG